MKVNDNANQMLLQLTPKLVLHIVSCALVQILAFLLIKF